MHWRGRLQQLFARSDSTWAQSGQSEIPQKAQDIPPSIACPVLRTLHKLLRLEATMTFADEAQITRETTCRLRKTFEHECHNIASGHCWPDQSNRNEREREAPWMDRRQQVSTGSAFSTRGTHSPWKWANAYASFTELPLERTYIVYYVPITLHPRLFGAPS